MTKKQFERLHRKWLEARTSAYTFQALHPEARLSADRTKADPKIVRKCDHLWDKFNKLDHRLYRYEQKRWLKRWRRTFVEPYGMFSVIPTVMCMLVARFDEYWQHDYNVHIVDEDGKIGHTARRAHALAKKVVQMGNAMYEEDSVAFEEYQAAIMEFFQYVAQNYWEWGD